MLIVLLESWETGATRIRRSESFLEILPEPPVYGDAIMTKISKTPSGDVVLFLPIGSMVL